MRVVGALLLVGACTRTERAPAPAVSNADAAYVRVRVGGVGVRGDVLWLDGERVVAAAPIVEGVGEVPAAAAAARTALVRLDSPAIGVRIVAATPGVELDLAAADVVMLRGRLTLPAGWSFDWLDLHLTPRLTELPPRVVLAEVAIGAMRGVYTTRRLTAPTFAVSVLRGTWELRVDHTVDAPMGAAPPDVAIAGMVVADGSAVTENVGGFQVVVARETDVAVTLRERPPE